MKVISHARSGDFTGFAGGAFDGAGVPGCCRARNKNYPYNPAILETFLKGVEEASKGRVRFVVSGPETVPSSEQPQPAGSGRFPVPLHERRPIISAPRHY